MKDRKPVVLQVMGLQRFGYDFAIEQQQEANISATGRGQKQFQNHSSKKSTRLSIVHKTEDSHPNKDIDAATRTVETAGNLMTPSSSGVDVWV